MIRRLLPAVVALFVAGSVAMAGGNGKAKGAYEEPYKEPATRVTQSFPTLPDLDWTAMRPTVGSYTTLWGFMDYQSNGGSPQHIRIQAPRGDTIHVVYMMSEDSANSDPSRRTAYAISTNRGATWNNFSNIRIPAGLRSGYPSLTLGQGVAEGVPFIANHNNPGTGNVSKVYFDSPPGQGQFVELNTVALLGTGADEPIWPYIAGTANGSLAMAGSCNTATTDYFSVTPDLVSWSPWRQYPGQNQAGGKYPVAANANGRVGIQLNTSNGTANTGVYWLESTNNGTTWPSFPDTVYRLWRVDGPESLKAYVSSDLAYNGNEPLMAITEFNGQDAFPSWPRIVFWSRTTGFRNAVRFDSTRFIGTLNKDQRFHSYTVGWPTIGVSGSVIVMAFQAFQRDTSASGFNFSDIWFTKSSNGGVTWDVPVNLTNTPAMDERYPSMAKWNPAGEANMVWQEDREPGAHAFADLAPISRSLQVFYRRPLTTGVEDKGGRVPERFALDQNYPNPFNPSTAIDFALPVRAEVRLTVYDVLGREVRSLVNGTREAGKHTAEFRADGLASGVYYAVLRAGDFTATRTMVLVK
jgi:hypothetical protein